MSEDEYIQSVTDPTTGLTLRTKVVEPSKDECRWEFELVGFHEFVRRVGWPRRGRIDPCSPDDPS